LQDFLCKLDQWLHLLMFSLSRYKWIYCTLWLLLCQIRSLLKKSTLCIALWRILSGYVSQHIDPILFHPAVWDKRRHIDVFEIFCWRKIEHNCMYLHHIQSTSFCLDISTRNYTKYYCTLSLYLHLPWVYRNKAPFSHFLVFFSYDPSKYFSWWAWNI